MKKFLSLLSLAALTIGLLGSCAKIEERIDDLEKRVGGIESVSIIPAYGDGSVEAVGSILTLKCIVRPAEALNGMVSLKDSLLIYADSVKTKAATPAYMEIKVSEASVLDAAQGAITLKADISNYLPKGADKALTVALKIKNGISDYTTEFVPVTVVVVPVSSVSIEPASVTLEVGDTLRLAATIAPENATNKEVSWSSNRTDVATVDATGKVTAVAAGTTTITVTTKDGGKTNTCSVTVTAPSPAADYVEIGGVKWATMNLGATTVAGSLATCAGDYYAWGETEPYYGTLTWDGTTGTFSNWKEYKTNGYAWQSYCGASSFSEWSTPPYDNTTKILKAEYDAATAKLGTGWRMPTSAEFKALNDACINGSYDKTTYASNACGATTSFAKGIYWCGNYDGVAGCLFCDGTNKVFFPAAGLGYNTSLDYAGSYGYYWSSSLYSGYTVNACRLRFNSDDVDPQGNNYRCYGYPVRPVKAEDAPTPTLPDGALPGVFSVSAAKTVHFSKGNLTYDVNAETDKWKFYEHQYDCATGYDANLISLFTWGYNAEKSIVPNGSASDNVSRTSGNLEQTEDWGCTIGDGNTWRTLTTAEWQYLFNTRSNASSLYKYGVTVCGKTNCVVLLPDDWEWDASTVGTDWQKNTSNIIEYSEETAIKWSTMQAAGAVCLPATGLRNGSGGSGVDLRGYYWSSTAIDSSTACRVFINSSNVTSDSGNRWSGYSVRLITE